MKHEDRTIARERSEVGQLVIVVPSHHDAVELDRREARRDGGIDRPEYPVQPRPACDGLEAIRAKRVER